MGSPWTARMDRGGQMAAVPIQEAAQRLGLSVVAVRKRAQRGTLTGFKRDGIWYIEMDDGQSTGPPTGSPQVDNIPEPITRELVDILRDEIGFLRRELEARTQEVERAHILLQNAQRLIPATVPDAPQPPERVADDETRVPSGTTAHSAPQRDLAASQQLPRRSSWWSRLFGLE